MPTQENIQFGQIAVANGMLTQEKFNECVNVQQVLEKMSMKEDLTTIILKKGYLSKDQVEIIFQMQGRNTGAKNIGGYEIIEKLGEGGMGIVYKARQVNMDRIVALKILSPSFGQNQDYIQRFFREARSAGKLDHPNVVRGIDVGEADGYYYFSMEYVDGESLKQFLDRSGRMNEKAAGMVVIQVAKALEHAQKFKIVHRDIKPDNIFLSKDNVVKLGDLGLAKPEGEVSLTQVGIPVGTPCYISPEQALNTGQVDVRSDIYSLGVTLYQMLTGTVPYQDSSYLEAVTKHVQEELPPIRQINPTLSDEIVFLVNKMTRKEQKDRFQSPTELIHVMNTFVQGGKLSPDGQQILPAKGTPMGGSLSSTAFDATAPMPAQRPPQPQSSFSPPVQLPLDTGDSSELLIDFNVPQAGFGDTPNIPLSMEDFDDESVITTKPLIGTVSESDDEVPLKIAPKLGLADPANKTTQKVAGPAKGMTGKQKVSDRLQAKGMTGKQKVSDRLQKQKISDRIPSKGRVSDRLARQTAPPQKSGGGVKVFLFILLLAGGVIGGYLYLESQKQKKPASQGGTGTGSGTGTEVATGMGTGTGSETEQNPPRVEKNPEKKAFDALMAQIILSEKNPEQYPTIIADIKNYLQSSPPPLAEYSTKAQTLLLEYQKKFEKASLDKCDEIFDRIKSDFLPDKAYARGIKRALELFPKAFQPSPGHEQIKRLISQLKEGAYREFEALEKQALELVGIYKFDEARNKIAEGRPFGYFEENIQRVVQKIDKAEGKYKKKIADQKALEALRQKFDLFEKYYNSYYAPFYREFIKDRSYEAALNSCQKALGGVDPSLRPLLEQDEKWISAMKDFYEAAREGASKLASNSTEITLQMEGKTLSGILKSFAGDAFYLENKGRKNPIDFKKISPQELYQIFLDGEQQKKKGHRLALVSMLIFESDFPQAKNHLARMQEEGIGDGDALMERWKLLKQRLVEEEAKGLYYRARETKNDKNWSRLAELVEQMSQTKFQTSFFLNPYEKELETWKKMAQEAQQKEPVDLSSVSGKWYYLADVQGGLSGWEYSEGSWWAKQGVLVGLKKGGWLIRKNYQPSGSKAFSLLLLANYHFSFQIQIPGWDKVDSTFLEVHMPYWDSKAKTATIYAVEFTPQGILLKGAKKILKFPRGLKEWKQITLTFTTDENGLERYLKASFQAEELGSVNLKEGRALSLPYKKRGLGFFQLIDSEKSSSLEIKRIQFYIK